MARNCSHDFAKYQIRVNSVCAGCIETPISAIERRDQGWTFEEWQALKIKDVLITPLFKNTLKPCTTSRITLLF